MTTSALELPFPVPRPLGSMADVLAPDALGSTPWAWSEWRWLDDHMRELVRQLERRPMFRDGARVFAAGELLFACRLTRAFEVVRVRRWLRTWARIVGAERAAALRAACEATSPEADVLHLVALGRAFDDVALLRVDARVARRTR